MNDDNEAITYHTRVFVVKKVTNLLMIILLFLGIMIPWWISRGETVEIIRYLVSERVSTASKTLANATEYLFRKYEIAGNQLKSIVHDPKLAGCTSEGILHFIHFAQTMNVALSPKPYRFFLSNNQTSSCQLEFDQEGYTKFKVYISIPYNDTHDQLKLFNETANFSPEFFHPETDGNNNVVDIFFHNQSDFRLSKIYPLPFWTNSAVNHRKFWDNRTLTFVYPLINQNDLYNTTLCGISLFNQDIYKLLNSIPSSTQTNWAFLDEEYHVLINKEYGALYPNSVSSANLSQFPNIEDMPVNSLWKDASLYVKSLKNDNPLLFAVNELQYYISKRPISTNGALLRFNIYLLISHDELISKIFKPVNILFLIVVILAAFSIFLQWLLKDKIIKIRDEKLFLSLVESNESQNIENNGNSPKNYHFPYFNTGNIGYAISNLKKLELSSPEEVMINKLVESAIKNFSKTRNRLFSITDTSNCSKKCEFCKYLNAEPYKRINSEDQYYSYLQQQNSLLLLNKKQNPLLNIYSKIDDITFHPYRFMNFISSMEITKNLLDENYTDDEAVASFQNSSHLMPKSAPNSKDSYTDHGKQTIDETYFTWKILTYNRIKNAAANSQTEKNDFAIDENIPDNFDVHKEIIIKLVDLIDKKKLIFIDLDPDQILEFVSYWSKFFIKNPFATYESLCTIDYLLSLDFSPWINNKLDIFTLILCVLIRDILTFTDEEVVKFLNYEKEKLKKGIINNNNYNSNNYNNNNYNNNNNDNNNYNNNDNNNNIDDNNNNNNQNFEDTVFSSTTFNGLFEIFDMPIFELYDETVCNTKYINSDFQSPGSSNSDNEEPKSSVLSNLEPVQNKNNSINNNNNYNKDVFTLNDSYSKERRQIEIFKYVFTKFVPLSNRSFNHVYIEQRLTRLLKTCQKPNHFEIFSEFENRAGSSDFSPLSNSEDLDIFLKAIFSFCDYSRFWCEESNFEKIYEEFNQNYFTPDEITDEKFVWGFHNEILKKIVLPFFEILSIFCPMKAMNKRISINSLFIERKMDGKSINNTPSLQILKRALSDSKSDQIESANYETFSDDFDYHESQKNTRNFNGKKYKNYTFYTAETSYDDFNEYDYYDENITDEIGSDVDGD